MGPDPSSDRPKWAGLVPHCGFQVKRLTCLSRVKPVLPSDT
jgi:hypothetical protein